MANVIDLNNINLDNIKSNLPNQVQIKEIVPLGNNKGYVIKLSKSLKIKVFGQTQYKVSSYGESASGSRPQPSSQAICSPEAKQVLDLIESQLINWLASEEHVNPTKKLKAGQKPKPLSVDKITNKFHSFTKQDEAGNDMFTFKPNVGIFNRNEHKNSSLIINNYREHKFTSEETGELITDYTYDVIFEGNTYPLKVISGSIAADSLNSTILDIDTKQNLVTITGDSEGSKIILENIDYIAGMRVSKSINVKFLNYEKKEWDKPKEYPDSYPLVTDHYLTPKSTIGFGFIITGIMVVKDEYFPQTILTDLYFLNTNRSCNLDEDDGDDNSSESSTEQPTKSTTPAPDNSSQQNNDDDDSEDSEEEEEEEEDSSDEE
jgi:hypothetical protein